MTNKRYLDSLWAFVLATLLSFGGTGCILSGFNFPDVHLGVMFGVCVLSSLVWAIAARFHLGIPVVSILSTIFFIFPNVHTIMESEKVLVHKITLGLHNGYGWGVLSWENMSRDATAQEMLLLIACIVSLLVAWTVVRQKKATLATIVAFLPLGVCMMLTDTVPDTDYLILMLLGLILLALTNPLRRVNPQQANRATAMLLVPLLLVTIVFFQIVPRDNYQPNQGAFDRFNQWLEENPFWQQLVGNGPSWFMGDSGANEISLDDLGDKMESDKTAFHVTAAKSGYLYLRGRAYDTYDGKSWTASEVSSGIDKGWGTVFGSAPKVTVRMLHSRGFYYFPGDSGPTGKSRYFENGMLPNPDQETTYEFYWGTPLKNAKIEDEVRQQCLQLPEETAAWAKKALEEYPSGNLLVKTSNQAYRIARAVCESARYSLDPSAMPEGEQDFAQWFYTEAEFGYCIHFATTATVLLRAAGIPARYVTGYALEVPAGQEVEVSQSKAHAWVEYFTYHTGWQILDATPGYNNSLTDPTVPTEETTEPTVETTAPTEETTEPTVETTEATTEPTVETSAPTESTQATTQPVESTGNTPTAPTSDLQEQSSPVPGIITAVLLWTMGICAAVWGQYLLRIRIRRWYGSRGNANEQALARWKSARIRSRIFRQKPPAQLHELAEKAKYSQHTLTAEELGQFDRYMTDLAAALQEKPWLLRWLLRLTLAIE